MAKNTNSHGGRRPGSGRKPLPPDQKIGRKYKLIQTSLPDDVLERLDDRVAYAGSTRAAVMRDILTDALSPSPFDIA